MAYAGPRTNIFMPDSLTEALFYSVQNHQAEPRRSPWQRGTYDRKRFTTSSTRPSFATSPISSTGSLIARRPRSGVKATTCIGMVLQPAACCATRARAAGLSDRHPHRQPRAGALRLQPLGQLSVGDGLWDRASDRGQGREAARHGRLRRPFLPGRSKLLRPANKQEIKATTFVGMEMEQASGKIRAMGVHDEEEDYAVRPGRPSCRSPRSWARSRNARASCRV